MKKFLTLVVAALLAAFTLPALADCYSDGVRTGTIQKFSKKGMFVKSWEGELVMQGTKIRGNKHGVVGGDVWQFSVTDPGVAAVIDNAVMNGSDVALRYCQANPLDPTTSMSTETSYRIVQAVERKAQ